MDFNQLFTQYRANTISGRYIQLTDIHPLFIQRSGQLEVLGKSVSHQPILSYTIGQGSTRLLFWSQMHGNESTATKSVIDLCQWLDSEDPIALRFKDKFTFCFIPMLNPDGAKAYTRVNANGVDLNRDFLQQTQPETKIFLDKLNNFKPDYAFNLHDQRTIFGLEHSDKPATLSFLAPSYDETKSYNTVREKAIQVILGMHRALQKEIPGQIGRFDDGFNPNCVGDYVTQLGIPTILVESGHYPNDYQREECRRLTFIALLSGILQLDENDLAERPIEEYLNIPQNKIVFYDFGFKNVNINYDGIEKITNFVAHYREELIEDKLVFNAYIEDSSNLPEYFVHTEWDAKGAEFHQQGQRFPQLGAKADFRIGTQEFKNAKPIELDL